MQLASAIDEELDGLEEHDKITLIFESVKMTDEEYDELPESEGH